LGFIQGVPKKESKYRVNDAQVTQVVVPVRFQKETHHGVDKTQEKESKDVPVNGLIGYMQLPVRPKGSSQKIDEAYQTQEFVEKEDAFEDEVIDAVQQDQYQDDAAEPYFHERVMTIR
jgi:hypothetical protein